MLHISAVFLLFILSGCKTAPSSKPLMTKIEKPEIFEIPVKPTIIPQSVKYPKEWSKKVSVAISSNISLQKSIMHLAQQSKISISFGKGLEDSTGHTYVAHNQPLLEVIKRICCLGKWRLCISDNAELIIQKNEPYYHTYSVSFLSGNRKTSSSTEINKENNKDEMRGINVIADAKISSTSESYLWKELKDNLNFILNSQSNETALTNKYSINEQSGLIVVRATQEEHRQIYSFLKRMQRAIGTQVLVEAKILSVSLNEDYENGINWESIFNTAVEESKKFEGLMSSDITQIRKKIQAVEFSGKLFTSLISGARSFEKFGQVNTLSNPRTTIQNNQPVLLKVSENLVYFRLHKNTDIILSSGAKNASNVETYNSNIKSEICTIPVGTALLLQPSINFATRTVTLYIRPTISSVANYQKDPGIEILNAEIKQKYNLPQPINSDIPVMLTSEWDTVLSVQDGEFIVIGGLIQQTRNSKWHENNGRKSYLDKSETRESNKELVILAKVHILDSSNLHIVNEIQEYELRSIDEQIAET